MAISVIVSLWALPRLTGPRIEANEAAVLSLLRMQASAQRLWREETGEWAEFQEIAFSPPKRDPNEETARRILLPSWFYPNPISEEAAEALPLRSGYFFRQGFRSNGVPAGCWAYPKLRGYTGERAFWLDYRTGHTYLILNDGQPAGPLPPPQESLGPILD